MSVHVPFEQQLHQDVLQADERGCEETDDLLALVFLGIVTIPHATKQLAKVAFDSDVVYLALTLYQQYMRHVFFLAGMRPLKRVGFGVERVGWKYGETRAYESWKGPVLRSWKPVYTFVCCNQAKTGPASALGGDVAIITPVPAGQIGTHDDMSAIQTSLAALKDGTTLAVNLP
ncbi:hypothetical protein EDB92DRAFT_1818673 [Lactarius akahatsu]|uniref:Uncharacterized protein n=1 Tax=Lactarius akahatsu TaxID=416441 RepID=A0AAD4QAP7_9AGAM|nr:hypothetical protein EDB92DRAFT_1818673 [Lactarius akahatsu]